MTLDPAERVPLHEIDDSQRVRDGTLC
jgi:hypothetical protein